MKIKSAIIALLTVLLSASAVMAQDGFGVGVIVGEPTGISVKKWLGTDRAIDGAAAWSLSGDHNLQLHADYLVHDFGLLKPGNINGKLPVYVGAGGRILFSDDSHGRHNDTVLGVRVPLGISYIMAKAPVDFFVEIVPILDVVPNTEFDINAAIGARFYFR
ncbi:MAG: DUF3996 domain-containing protein [Geobacter sp.]|nr:DUF3996 domain-containing protein [Geobacter sp.]